ncbi:hypothetical protein WJX72_002915 [[Myrmecia] bisecta]|uniref:STI1 domain-containing protein n=1 Tax=[Myrmecia] bisecta TaxID=41462 RepID=A0AAW1QA77_9CHLO
MSSLSQCVGFNLLPASGRRQCRSRKEQARLPRRCLCIRASSGSSRSQRQEAELPTVATHTVDTVPTEDFSQQQSGPQQQYYQGVPQYPVAPPPQPAAAAATGLPPLVWIGVGIVGYAIFQKIAELVKGGPQKVQEVMMQQMMQQMMKGMNQPGGQGMPGMPPGFPGAGGFPPGFPNMPPPGQKPGAGFSGPTYDTTATTSEQPRGSSAATSTSERGARFQENKAKSSGAAATASPASAEQPAAPAPPKPKAASFSDVDDEESNGSGAASTSGATSSAQQPKSAFFSDADTESEANGSSSGQAGASGGPRKKSQVDMLEKMLKDPKMQELLYPYLPEPMRNPQTFDWMMSNPQYREQLETMMEQQGMDMNPEMLSMMEKMDYNSDEMTSQLGEMGLTPNDVISKIMSEPELAQAFSKPNVQKAIMDITQNPANISKYVSDPEVMLVFGKMTELFPQGGPMGAGPVPPAPPAQP